MKNCTCRPLWKIIIKKLYIEKFSENMLMTFLVFHWGDMIPMILQTQQYTEIHGPKDAHNNVTQQFWVNLYYVSGCGSNKITDLAAVISSRVRVTGQAGGSWLLLIRHELPWKHDLWNFGGSLKYWQYAIFALHLFYSVFSSLWIMCKIRPLLIYDSCMMLIHH